MKCRDASKPVALRSRFEPAGGKRLAGEPRSGSWRRRAAGGTRERRAQADWFGPAEPRVWLEPEAAGGVRRRVLQKWEAAVLTRPACAVSTKGPHPPQPPATTQARERICASAFGEGMGPGIWCIAARVDLARKTGVCPRAKSDRPVAASWPPGKARRSVDSSATQHYVADNARGLGV